MVNLGMFVIGLAAVLGARAGSPDRTFAVPESIRLEHEELHGALAAATKLPGRTGAAAKHVAELLHPHFVSEEEFALPPLALLLPLAGGTAEADMHDAIALSDRLKAELPRMLDEHKAIVVALEELGRAAKAEGHAEVSRFVENLTSHARHEEQVLYPAAILVGEYLKLRLAQ